MPDVGVVPGVHQARRVGHVRQNRVARMFRPGPHPVAAGGNALGPQGTYSRRGGLGDRTVDDRGHAVVDDRDAAETPARIVPVGRGTDGHGPMFPMNQIPADGMAPVDVAPVEPPDTFGNARISGRAPGDLFHLAPGIVSQEVDGVGIVLVHDVIKAVMVDQPVRIAHPTASRGEVICGSMARATAVGIHACLFSVNLAAS